MATPVKVCLCLVDGLGVGRPDPTRNPASRPDLPLLSRIAGGHSDGEMPHGGHLAPADAALGVRGTPQSATGHTALLTGVNAPQAIGRHLAGLPDRALRSLLARHSILRAAVEQGRRAVFANTFGPGFFTFPRQPGRRRLAATTTAVLAAGLPLLGPEANRAGQAVAHDFTNAALRAEGADVPVRTPVEAGRLLAAIAGAHDLTLFEHFLTDSAGHAAEAGQAAQVLRDLEEFLDAFLPAAAAAGVFVVLASDHGNIEDLTIQGHTRNPAAVVCFGPEASARASAIRDLTHVAAVVREALGLTPLAAVA